MPLTPVCVSGKSVRVIINSVVTHTMQDLEAQVERGQAALGRLFRQFLSVNDYKHVQFIHMATALTGVRWLHSSQISTLKRGAVKNLTGFPLYSVALVNRRIWEINQGLANRPSGTKSEDWTGKVPMQHKNGEPLDIGDLWRIYFGELEPPYFNAPDSIEIDDQLSAVVCQELHRIFLESIKQIEGSESEWLDKNIAESGVLIKEQAKLLKGVFLGVSELSAERLKENMQPIGRVLHALTGETFTDQQVYELCLERMGEDE